MRRDDDSNDDRADDDSYSRWHRRRVEGGGRWRGLDGEGQLREEGGDDRRRAMTSGGYKGTTTRTMTKPTMTLARGGTDDCEISIEEGGGSRQRREDSDDLNEGRTTTT
ncbi:hypothetical protein GUJ93_ZPchr0007g4288 [Zizania palustris]|uniref:Uncharacterized protein n=1 Tax=Zizania palustris TaxID=103762 RepID=A0A8J5VZY0_ZIZPA|nr:hypothetical protein GUJ93_ZPchr0007g4288 [Zizania palustris]